MGKGRKGIGAIVVAGLLVAGCGARVAPYLGAASGTGVGPATAGVGGSTGSGALPGGTSPTTTAAGGVPAGSVGSSPGVTAPAGGSGPVVGAATAGSPAPTAAPAAAGFSFQPQAEAAACPGNAGNTASDVGVTPATITLGNVSGLTGPLANSFNQGAEGVQALFAAVDGAGGICGRQLRLTTEDDGQNASNNAADVGDLIPKAFAFVGSTSDGDNGGVPQITQAGVPDVGFAINCNRSQSPDYWSAAGGSCYERSGRPYIYDSGFALAKAQGYFPSRMAFISYSIAISAQAAQEFAYEYQELGGTVCYTDYSVSPATASLASDVVQMENNHCQGVDTALDVTGMAKLLQAMAQQSYHPAYVATTFDGYTPAQITSAGTQAAQGLLVGLPFVPLDEPNPTVQLYLRQLATYEPGKEPSGFGFLAWESAQMLVYALVSAGHNPTRASVTKIFGALQNWDGGGALGPYTPATHSVSNCDVDVVVQGSAFVRKAPSSGLFCSGNLVPAGP